MAFRICMPLTAYRFRLKDSSCRNRLRQLGFGVNAIWNYCTERTAYQWAFRRTILSVYALHKLTAGVDWACNGRPIHTGVLAGHVAWVGRRCYWRRRKGRKVLPLTAAMLLPTPP